MAPIGGCRWASSLYGQPHMTFPQAFPFIDDRTLAALDLLHVPIHIYSFTQAQICWANAAALEMWQATNLTELQERQNEPPSTATARRLAEYQDAFSNGASRTEVWTFYPSGKPTVIHSHCRGVQLEGHARAMLVESSPLEPLLLPAAELRALEAVRHAELMVSMFSRTGQSLMRNPSAAAYFKDHDQRPPESGDLFRSMFANARDAEGLLACVEADGQATGSFILELPGHPLHRIHVTRTDDPVTGLPALLVLQEDVSVSQITHQKLEESEDAFLSILELTRSAVVIISAHTGIIIYRNTVAAALFGDAAAGCRAVSDLLVADAGYTEFRATVMAHGGGAVDTMLKLAGSELALATLTGSKVRYEGQDAIIMTVGLKDHLISESFQLKRALADQARDTDLLRQQFACAAHEFRTPLAIIDSTAQRIERTQRSLEPDRLKAKAQKIRRNVQRVLQLLDNGAQPTRAHDTPLQYAPALHDLAASLRSVVHTMQDSFPNLKLDCKLGKLPRIWIDQTLIEHLFENLIGNSVKYSDEAPRIDIRSYVTAAEIEITLRDWGIGIPLHDRADIFEPRARASNVGSRPGSGLGLYIVTQIMAVHGGHVELVDISGPGTKFRLRFPRDYSAEDPKL